MQYSQMYKRKMIQKMTGPNAICASALSKQVDVSQKALDELRIYLGSRWN